MKLIYIFIISLFTLPCITALKIRKPSYKLSRKHLVKTNPFENINNKKGTVLFDSYYEEEKTITPKAIITSVVLFLGIFGVGFLGPVNTLIKDFTGNSKTDQTVQLKKTGEDENRGALTKLTRKEINKKLSQVPVFFATKGADVIYTSDGEGYLFLDKVDADKYAKSNNNLDISSTTLGNVYYALIDKKMKLGAYLDGPAGKADPEALYKLQMSSSQVNNIPSDWLSNHNNDIPLYLIPNLGFSKNEGLEVPLFTNKEDAITSYNRLKASKSNKSIPSSTSTFDVSSETPINNEVPENLQIVSLKDLITKFSKGGFEGRAIEIYPSMVAIEDATNLLSSSK
jgi:hypothetical protein